jgi:phosphoribosyl-AMP cyclohydrolase
MSNPLDGLKYNADGLIPAIVQDDSSGEVLMMAWMNRESLQKTLETGLCTYWSRSRGKFWVKGETSGHVQKVRRISVDCDQDTLLIRVEQTGAACHENYRSCFFRDLRSDGLEVNDTPKLS